MSINTKLQNYSQSIKGMANIYKNGNPNNLSLPNLELSDVDISGLIQTDISKKRNLSDTSAINTTPKLESTYTKSNTTALRKTSNLNHDLEYQYVHSVSYNYRETSLTNIPKYTTTNSSKSAHTL
jgi:hypothetical protein